MRSTLAVAFAFTAVVAFDAPARACGCFTPPDPTVTIVQSGEQIVFATDGLHVTAHVKIQYAGDAKDFGWLVPLPSLPKVALSTDELFASIEASTAPVYRLRTVREACNGSAASTTETSGGGGGCGAVSVGPTSFDPVAPGGAEMMEMAANPALVSQNSIGPYDYAVLKADDKSELLDWLAKNHYFVPATNNDVIGPYLHPGAYFLALKLKSGRTVGDLQPIAITYDSDLPMIPIVLTSVGAQANLGIQAFILGSARAIPRNYHHTVLDDMAVDWSAGSVNYTDLVIRAVGEAPKHHSFVTEYAGSSAVAKGTLAPAGRFGDLAQLRKITDAATYLDYLVSNRYPFNPVLFEILERYLPPPADVLAAGITPTMFYGNLRYYLGAWQQALVSDGGSPDGGPDGGGPDGGIALAFDPNQLTDEIDLRIVEPTRAAEKMFSDQPVLTRLYTTLSPIDMTDDPVFSFNPDLPDVPAAHEATLDIPCGNTPFLTVQGLTMIYPSGRAPSPLPSLPASLFVQALPEAGPPTVEVDNQAAIIKLLQPFSPMPKQTQPLMLGTNKGCGSCGVHGTVGRPLCPPGLALLALVGLSLWLSRRRGGVG